MILEKDHKDGPGGTNPGALCKHLCLWARTVAEVAQDISIAISVFHGSANLHILNLCHSFFLHGAIVTLCTYHSESLSMHQLIVAG